MTHHDIYRRGIAAIARALLRCTTVIRPVRLMVEADLRALPVLRCTTVIRPVRLMVEADLRAPPVLR